MDGARKTELSTKSAILTSILVITTCYLSLVTANKYIYSALECKKTAKGAEYRGTISVTEAGLTCQRWDYHIPHRHSYIDDYLFPDNNITLAENYCRNPGGVKKEPWCFTQHPDTRWQYCAVPACGCRKSKAGWDYTGKVSVTSSGRRCQTWASQTPHAHSYMDGTSFPDPSIEDAGNYCRNPDRWETKGPWCYTQDPKVRWEYCNVPFCECKVSRGGHQYGGRISKSRSGLTCQRWDSQTPHAHRYAEKACGFPEESVTEAANYCRNPEPNELGGPWCFTTDPNVRWEYCDIEMCGPDDDVEVLGKMSNMSYVLGESVKNSGFGLSRTEMIFLGLFAASMVLTITTISAAIVVVHVYRKREPRHAQTCARCGAALGVRDNEKNVNREKQDGGSFVEYENGPVRDRTYASKCERDAYLGQLSGYGKRHTSSSSRYLVPNPNNHTYATIPGTPVATPEGATGLLQPATPTTLRAHDVSDPTGGDIYENIGSRCHVVLPARRNSIS